MCLAISSQILMYIVLLAGVLFTIIIIIVLKDLDSVTFPAF